MQEQLITKASNLRSKGDNQKAIEVGKMIKKEQQVNAMRQY